MLHSVGQQSYERARKARTVLHAQQFEKYSPVQAVCPCRKLHPYNGSIEAVYS
jgi:hypothetical protein